MVLILFLFCSAIVRRCTNPTTLKGIDIPLDLEIAVDVLSIHYDAELWGPQDPHEFHPERFGPEYKRNPLAFLSFGAGPRNCIGKLVKRRLYVSFKIKLTLIFI